MGVKKVFLKVGLLMPQTPLAEKFINLALVSENTNQHTKFQLPSLISFGDIKGVQN